MTVAVEQGLEQVWRFLEHAGCRVMPLNAITGAVDAVVYRRTLPDSALFGTHAFMRGEVQGHSRGIFMVNAGDKTPEQIYAILRSRVYTPLF